MRADSIAGLAGAITEHVSASRSVVLARIWFVHGDGSLTLAASAGTPSGGGSYTRMDGEFRAMAIADAAVATIAAAREPFIVRGIRGDEEWLTNSAWAARQGVRSLLAFPLVVDLEVIGVLAIFDREMPDDDLLGSLSLVADIAAVRARQLSPPSPLATSVPDAEGRRSAVFTRAELRGIEKANIEAALAKTQGKVFGADGAAALLGMRPTTLASRIRALGIR